jgi:TldD protein
MHNIRKVLLGLLLISSGALPTVSRSQRLTQKSVETIERAMTDELARAKTDLHLQGLIDPFFISYTVTDRTRLEIQASYGALLRSAEDHTRAENVRLLVNNYALNDENFSDNSGFFGASSSPDNTLPIDDDYLSIRRALWLSTDDLFKGANETFTKKKAALEHKQLADDVRDLPDFAHAPAVQVAEEPLPLGYDRRQLEDLVRDLSVQFSVFKDIQTSSVILTVTNAYEFIRNSEGTSVRKPVTFCELSVHASAQAEADGEPLSLSFSIGEKRTELLPTKAELIKRTRKLAGDLLKLRLAPRFDEKGYTGPVVFAGTAARDLMADVLIARLAAQREEALGGGDVSQMLGGSKRSSLKDKLNTRILPTSISVIDHSRPTAANANMLGAFAADEEGTVPMESLLLVDKGMLTTLYMTRTPTKEVREPNGHARALTSQPPGIGENSPAPGIVEIHDTKGLTQKQMDAEMFTRAKEDGNKFVIVVRSILPTSSLVSESGFNIADMVASSKAILPELMYKVYPDGHEELVRGGEIALPSTRDLREIITSSDVEAYNLFAPVSGGLFSFASKVPATIIAAQRILCPELEVQRRKQSANPTAPVVSRP